MSDMPEQIWLQCFAEAEQVYGDEITWCEDKINDDDVEYIRADKFIELREALVKHAKMPGVEGWCPICEGFGWLSDHKDGCIVGDVLALEAKGGDE